MSAWPDYFPSFLIDSYSYQNDKSMVRTDMEGGPPRQRNEFTQVPTKIKVSTIMDITNYEIFRGWFKHVLNEGQDYFTVDLDLENGLSEQQARFTGPYKTRKTSFDKWSIEGTLELAVAPTISKELAEILTVGFSIEEMEAAAQNCDDLLQLMVTLTNT